ncbi:hypothetical protein COY05_00800 [Candidatus Peregrinibacteria bacterium CG_4_10_14_0_2_um_filter_38_24]|nr:MAG: hypothetical protein COY05_00800 [Candidatus Peregrinibacteria bacterium CG_4_10_14_0_2_um_filter_38_24]PJC38868.1 MAG: hypothetical protein CO044_02695 [Candidatus Peregrinibacteria bacterium CG_4_9_14_0_2_um_filter_38_9]
MRKITSQKGFTLIEIVAYFAITSVFLFAISVFALQIIDASRLSENMNEIQYSDTFSTSKFIEKIHSALSVDTGNSVFDNDTGKLALNGSPNILFYLENSNIYIKEENETPIKLNANATNVTKLRFHQITAAKTPTQIVIDGEINTMSNISNLSHTYPFHLSVSLRK